MGAHTHAIQLDVLSEVLQQLEKLVPVPGCALGHYDKAKASTPQADRTILHVSHTTRIITSDVSIHRYIPHTTHIVCTCI